MKGKLALALLGLAGAVHAADPAKYMKAELVAETARPKPGSTILVGFRMTPQPGWHGYWSNPGDSGIAPSVRWRLPSGVKAGPLLHPAPTLLLADGISSFVHAGPHVLLVRIDVGRSVVVGTPIPVQANLDWAACTAAQCVPLHETFTLNLLAGDGTLGDDAGMLKAAAAKLPRSGFHGTFSSSDKQIRLLVPASLRLDPGRTRFFPNDSSVFNTAKARNSDENGGIAIVGPAVAADASKTLSGVVSDGTVAYGIAFTASADQTQTRQSPGTTSAGAEPSIAEIAPSSRPRVRTEQIAPQVSQQPKRSKSHGLWLWAGAACIVFLGAVALMRRA